MYVSMYVGWGGARLGAVVVFICEMMIIVIECRRWGGVEWSGVLCYS